MAHVVDAAAWTWGFLAALLYEQRRLWTLGHCSPWALGLLAGVAYRRTASRHPTPSAPQPSRLDARPRDQEPDVGQASVPYVGLR